MKRLRNPCEHVDEMHPYGHYVEHELGEWTGIRNTPDGPEQYLEIRICPGGEFLPEDALVIERVDGRASCVFPSCWRFGEWRVGEGAVCNQHLAYALSVVEQAKALATHQVGEPG